MQVIRSTNKIVSQSAYKSILQYTRKNLSLVQIQKSALHKCSNAIIPNNYKKNIITTTVNLSYKQKRYASSVKCPSLGDSILEGDVLEWKFNEGDFVKEDDVLLVLETAKVVIDIPTPYTGVQRKIHIQTGDVSKVGDILCEIDTDAKGSEVPSSSSASSSSASSSSASSTSSAKSDPSTQPQAQPQSSTQPPTPQSQPQNKTQSQTSPTPTPTPTPAPAPTNNNTNREDRRVKMTRMRQTIGKRQKEAQNTLVMLTTFNEIDMSASSNQRDMYKEEFQKKHNVKFGFMSLFMKAASQALEKYPEVNAFIEGDQIVYRNYVDISVAVATPNGQVVPVIRNIQNKQLAEQEKDLQEYAKKARDNTIAMEDFAGGTFTISNGGVFGSLFGTPIINPPQSAILGMHSIVKRPVATKNGEVVVRPMMYVALTYDHRQLDGATAVQFLKHIKLCIEDPHRLLLNMQL